MTDATEKVDLAFLARQNEKILDEIRAARHDAEEAVQRLKACMADMTGELTDPDLRKRAEAKQIARRCMVRYANALAALAR